MTSPRKPWILFAMTLALSACESGGPSPAAFSHAAVVTPPASCNSGDPTCNIATDYPTQADLTVGNHDNILFSSADNALTLVPGSGAIVDTDGDNVPDEADECPGPGWRIPCDGDPSNDGIYDTTYFNSVNPTTVQASVSVSGSINTADAYILMDATGSMGGEQAQLITDLTTGTFVDPTQCASGGGTGLVGALKCVIPDLWMGLGEFKEIPLLPHANPFDQTPYHHYLDMTDNVQELIDAVSALVIHGNRDYPEATTQAIYSVVSGMGLGPFVPNRGACPASPPGRWGYPCFRPGALPIIILFTDADMWNGPRPTSPQYGDPPFDGILGAGAALPPVEQFPEVLYASDAFTALDLGDLSNKSVTVMGTNTNLGDDAKTWTVGACNYSGWGGFWGDGRDGFVKFSLSVPTVVSVSGEGTNYPTTNLALADSSGVFLDCDHGPGGGDWWGRLLNQNLGAGVWYAINDAAVSPSSSVSERRGPYQIRIQTTPADPSWQTADLPIPWANVETELLARGVKILSVISPNAAGLIAIPDATELANITGSLDQNGNPYMQVIAGDGTGLSTAVLDAVRALVGNTRRDITLLAEDNPATAAVDETQFVKLVEASTCPTTGTNNCLGGAGTATCLACLADAAVGFQFRIANDFVNPTALPQVFEFDMVALADGTTELARVPVRVMVPGVGGDYGSGFYQNTYDSDYVCQMPPERPDWGTLTWSGSTPSDSTVEFEFFTGNTLAELDAQIPASLVYPTDTTAQSYDIGMELVAAGQSNYMPFLRVKAKLNASTDVLSTPIFEGWSMQFNCVPFD